MRQIEKTSLDKFCKRLEEVGWVELKPQELTNYLLKYNFEKKIREINKDELENYKGYEDKILEQVYLMLQQADEIQLLNYLKFGVNVTLKIRGTTTPITIKLIDETIENNEFVYIREQEIKKITSIGVDRPDILLFVNGIPLVIIEGKSTFLIGNPFYEGLTQLMRYQKEIKGLFKFVQIGVSLVDDHGVYLPVFPRDSIKNPSDYTMWKTKVHNKYKENILDLLTPSRLIDIISNFTFFSKSDNSEKKKYIARYMQYFATKKILERANTYIANKSDRNKGLVWHWQGSGKTLTMFFTAFNFIKSNEERNPLVFIIIDRRELQRQLAGVLESIENKSSIKVKLIESIKDLKDTIENYESESGIRITTIQKFKEGELKVNKTIQKKEILLLIDEAHRTQYGDLGASMRKIFKKAIFIGFTGTPVFKNERNTFTHFAYPKEGELYLDVYFIRQSTEDGYTLPLTVRVVEEKKDIVGGVKIALSEDEIKIILNELKDKYGNEDLDALLKELGRSRVKKQLRDKIRRLKVILENQNRIAKVAEYIVNNIENDTENWAFKAMVVTSSRLASVRYTKKLRELFKDKGYPEEIVETVISYEHNEKNDEIHSYKEELINKYKVSDWDKVNAIIEDNFKKKEYPRVIVVTDKLLTGFDAPILKVMYVDKIMFYHKLLQAVARTNRPLREKNKTRGLIVDIVGLFNHIKKTLGEYLYLAESDAKDIKKDLGYVFTDPAKDIAELKDTIQFIKDKLRGYNFDLSKLASDLKNNQFDLTIIDKVASDFAIKYTFDSNVSKIIKSIKESISLYKSLGADPRKLEFKSEVTILLLLYRRFISQIGRNKKGFVKAFWEDLIKEIHKSTLVEDLMLKFEKEIEISTKKPKISEAASKFYELKNTAESKLNNPLYKEIYNKLIKIQESWVTRHIGVDSFIDELNKAGKELNKLEELNKKKFSEKLRLMLNKYLKSKGIKINLSNILSLSNKIKRKGRFLDNDKSELRVAIGKSLAKSKSIKDLNEFKKVEDEIFNIISSVILGDSCDN
ncbi:MAG: HsdR family type I site-specific deoxyribonuclease [Nanoarchaeota archaeon]|nr:HsdR family type I site-specific deoxyribonuclease [Nanoarchaeota archaeon]